MSEDPADLRGRGAEIRRQVLGEEYAATLFTDPRYATFADVMSETVWGALWDRPGLDFKTRALICVVADVAGGWADALGEHLKMSRRLGWTEDELVEVIIHLTGYVGSPLGRTAMRTAVAVFSDGAESRPDPT